MMMFKEYESIGWCVSGRNLKNTTWRIPKESHRYIHGDGSTDVLSVPQGGCNGKKGEGLLGVRPKIVQEDQIVVSGSLRQRHSHESHWHGRQVCIW